MSVKKNIINLIQDLATPHNNILIKEFAKRDDCEIKIWYAKDQDKNLYQWGGNISHEHLPAEFYGEKLNLSFIKYCLANKDEIYIIVGWMNINTKIIHILFFILGRNFNHWTDLPNTNAKHWKKIIRSFIYWLMKSSKAKIFGVGKITVDYFLKLGYDAARVINLPIFVKVDDDLEAYKARRHQILEKYSLSNDSLLVSGGSRLIHEKGYDLLIDAIALLPDQLKNKIKVIIVGSGVEYENLENKISDLNLTSNVHLEKWMDIEDFKTVIANSDVFMHPARFDSFGGTTLAMALGVPVIGSKGAGAAFDRIVHGVNGYLYQSENFSEMKFYLEKILGDEELRKKMAIAARNTALQWHPSRGAEILMKNAI